MNTIRKGAYTASVNITLAVPKFHNYLTLKFKGTYRRLHYRVFSIFSMIYVPGISIHFLPFILLPIALLPYRHDKVMNNWCSRWSWIGDKPICKCTCNNQRQC